MPAATILKNINSIRDKFKKDISLYPYMSQSKAFTLCEKELYRLAGMTFFAVYNLWKGEKKIPKPLFILRRMDNAIRGLDRKFMIELYDGNLIKEDNTFGQLYFEGNEKNSPFQRFTFLYGPRIYSAIHSRNIPTPIFRTRTGASAPIIQADSYIRCLRKSILDEPIFPHQREQDPIGTPYKCHLDGRTMLGLEQMLDGF